MPVESRVIPRGQSQRKEPRVLTQTPPPLHTSGNIAHSSISTYNSIITLLQQETDVFVMHHDISLHRSLLSSVVAAVFVQMYSIRWTRKYGPSCKRWCTNRRFATLTSYESASLNRGIISTSLSLILPSVSDALDFRRVLERTADISGTDCDCCIQYLLSNFRVMIR